MNTSSPILITGVPRSGSSMIADILRLCGVSSGTCNRMGENIVLYELHGELIRTYGADPEGQYPLPDVNRIPSFEKWKSIVQQVFTEEEQHNGWLYKDSRMSLDWPLWNNSFPDARWIVVRRNMPDIINSCLKTKWMNRFDDVAIREQVGVQTVEAGWRWWASQYQERFLEMAYSVRYLNTVWVERMAYDDFTEIQALVSSLGLQWNSEVEQFMNDKLKNSPQKKGRL